MAITETHIMAEGVTASERAYKEFEYNTSGKVPDDDTTHLIFHHIVASIPNNLCFHCQDLIQVRLHEGIRRIGASAFLGCRNLKEVVLTEGLIVLEISAFSGCISLNRVSIPSTVITIGRYAFSMCTSLCEVQFSEGLCHIDSAAFHKCKSLFAVSLPRSLKSVGMGSFGHCDSLCGIEIPSGTKLQIGEFDTGGDVHVANSCDSLVNVFLPASIPSRQDNLFDITWTAPTRQTLFGSVDLSVSECLRERFLDRPIHKACYSASQTTPEELLEMLEVSSSNRENIMLQATDGLGMTPFHIVVTSAVLRADLLVALLDKYPLEVLAEKDRFAKTMMDYLLLNPSCKASRLIQMVLEKTVLDPIFRWGLDSWKLELSTMVMNAVSWDREERHQRLQELLDKFEFYKRMEQIALLELTLWKMKVEASSSTFLSGGGTQSIIDRQACRMTCGANVAIPNVTSFL